MIIRVEESWIVPSGEILTDVAAIVFAFELDELCTTHRLSEGGGTVGAIGCDGDDASASRDDLASIIASRAGMEEDGVACRVGRGHGALGEEFLIEARHHLALCPQGAAEG